MAQRFKSGFSHRGTIKATDAILIWNVDTGVDEYAFISDLPVPTGFEPANANILIHIARTDNPHSVTAAQAGALGLHATADNSAGLNGHADTYFALASHNHSSLYEPVNVNIQAHIANTSNPHSVTPAQLGLIIGSDVLAYRTFGTAADHDVSYFLSAGGQASDSLKLGGHYAAYFEVANANIQNHITDNPGNPHNTTAVMIGAAPLQHDNTNHSENYLTTSGTAYDSARLNAKTEGNLSVLYAATAGAAPASDVYAWAKAVSKPSYTYLEVGAEQANSNIQLHINNNNQAHTDYLKNNANDSSSGSITATDFILA